MLLASSRMSSAAFSTPLRRVLRSSRTWMRRRISLATLRLLVLPMMNCARLRMLRASAAGNANTFARAPSVPPELREHRGVAFLLGLEGLAENQQAVGIAGPRALRKSTNALGRVAIGDHPDERRGDPVLARQPAQSSADRRVFPVCRPAPSGYFLVQDRPSRPAPSARGWSRGNSSAGHASSMSWRIESSMLRAAIVDARGDSSLGICGSPTSPSKSSPTSSFAASQRAANVICSAAAAFATRLGLQPVGAQQRFAARIDPDENVGRLAPVAYDQARNVAVIEDQLRQRDALTPRKSCRATGHRQTIGGCRGYCAGRVPARLRPCRR